MWVTVAFRYMALLIIHVLLKHILAKYGMVIYFFTICYFMVIGIIYVVEELNQNQPNQHFQDLQGTTLSRITKFSLTTKFYAKNVHPQFFLCTRLSTIFPSQNFASAIEFPHAGCGMQNANNP